MAESLQGLMGSPRETQAWPWAITKYLQIMDYLNQQDNPRAKVLLGRGDLLFACARDRSSPQIDPALNKFFGQFSLYMFLQSQNVDPQASSFLPEAMRLTSDPQFRRATEPRERVTKPVFRATSAGFRSGTALQPQCNGRAVGVGSQPSAINQTSTVSQTSPVIYTPPSSACSPVSQTSTVMYTPTSSVCSTVRQFPGSRNFA